MYWFYLEYLDEERRFRVHRVESDNEQEARKMHRSSCEFLWVTQHIEPSVSALFSRNGPTHRTLISGHRPGDAYHTEWRPVPCPDDVRAKITGLRMGDEAALH